MNPRVSACLSRLLSAAFALFLPLAAAAAEPAPPVAGSDYTVIATPRTWTAPVAGTVEVAEAFGYVCPHCAHFEPVLQAWKKKQPATVLLVTVPAPFGGYWLPYARVYFAAEKLGVLPRVHDALFDALHVKGTLPLQNPSPDELATFFAGYGVDRQTFVAVLRGPEVDARLAQARDFLGNAGVDSTPSMIVAGKYLVTVEGGFDRMLRTVDWLVARERGAAKKAAR